MQGSINFDGTLSGSIAGGGGGGSEVSITPILTSGVKIADYAIDETTGSLYAPESSELSAQSPLSIVSDVISIDLSAYDTASEIADTYPTKDYVNNQFISIGQDLTLNYQKKLTAGTGISIDPLTNTISSSASGGVDYSTTEQDTGVKWTDGRSIYQRTVVYTPNLNTNSYVTIDNTITTSYADHVMVKDMDWKYSDYIVAGQNTGGGGINITITSGGVSLENMAGVTAHDFYITLLYTKVSDL